MLSGDDQWREKADRLIEGVLSAAGENLIGHAALLNRIVLRAPDASALPARHPAREKVAAADGAAFVCVGERCSLPVTAPDQLAATVRSMSAP